MSRKEAEDSKTYVPVYSGGFLGKNKAVLPYEGSLCKSREEAEEEGKRKSLELPVSFDHVKVLEEGEGLYLVDTSLGFSLIEGPDFEKVK